jgi:hypothetical protein
MHQDSEAMATHCYWYYSVTCGQTPAKRYKYGVEVGSQCSSKLPLTPYTKSTRIWNHASTSLRVKGADGRLNATSSQRLQELLTNTDWDEQAFNSRRVDPHIAEALPAPVLQLLLICHGRDIYPLHGFSQTFRDLSKQGRVLVIRNRSDDRFGPGSRIIRLEDV